MSLDTATEEAGTISAGGPETAFRDFKNHVAMLEVEDKDKASEVKIGHEKRFLSQLEAAQEAVVRIVTGLMASEIALLTCVTVTERAFMVLTK